MPESKTVFPRFSNYFTKTPMDEEFVKAAESEDLEAEMSIDEFGDDDEADK